MTPFRLLFHAHTRASFDSIMSPHTILRFCRDRDIHAVAICDHDALAGLNAARQLAASYGVRVIPAVEFSTNAGDIIGLFVDALPPTDDVREVLRFIRHDCAGLAVLPHPYRGHDLDDIPLDQIDIIETGNARCCDQDNVRAESLARELGKPTIVGADAHVAGELGSALNTFHVSSSPTDTMENPEDVAIAAFTECQVRDILLHAPRQFICNRSPARFAAMSRIIKGVRKRRPMTVLKAGRALIREETHRRLWRFAGKASPK